MRHKLDKAKKENEGVDLLNSVKTVSASTWANVPRDVRREWFSRNTLHVVGNRDEAILEGIAMWGDFDAWNEYFDLDQEIPVFGTYHFFDPTPCA